MKSLVNLNYIFNYNVFILLLLMLSTIGVTFGNIALSVMNVLIIKDPKVHLSKSDVGTIMFSSLICRMIGKLFALTFHKVELAFHYI